MFTVPSPTPTPLTTTDWPSASASSGVTDICGRRAGSNEIGKATGAKCAPGLMFMNPTTHVPGVRPQSTVPSNIHRSTRTVLVNSPLTGYATLGSPVS